MANTINTYEAITLENQRIVTGIHYACANRGYAEGFALAGNLLLDTDGDWVIDDPTVANTQVAAPANQRIYLTAISLIASGDIYLTFKEQNPLGVISPISPTYFIATGGAFQSNHGNGVICSTSRGSKLLISAIGVNAITVDIGGVQTTGQNIGIGYLIADDYVIR